MKTIGTSVYVCGGGSAVYRLDGSGWRALAMQNLDPSSFLLHIDGLSEEQIYIISNKGVFFWDGKYAHYIKEISDRLTVAAIHIERPDIVWLCGWEGVLLRGNFRDGFARIPNPGRQMFVSIAEFQGNVYLGSTDTLWSYNGKTIAPVDLDVGERPRIWLLTRAADTLWAVGDAIYRLTSIGSWEHIPYDPL